MKAKAFIQVLRTNDWWNNIIPPILGFFALGQLSLAPDFRILYMFGNVFLLMIFTAIFGFFIGEWSDIKDDTKAGKKNLLVGKSSSFKFGFTILSVIGICFFSFQLRLSNFDLYLLVIAQMLCFILYSIPPFRLKKNKLASLVLDSLYSGTLMYVFVFAIGRQDATGSLVVLFIWGFLRGQRNYILHTLNDAKNDQQIGIKSIGNSYDTAKVMAFQKRIMLPLEVFAMCVFLYWIESPYNYILIAGYLFIVAYSFVHRTEEKKMSSYGFLSNINLFHEMLFPLLILIILSVLKLFWLIPLLLLLVLFKQYKEWSKAVFYKLKSLL